MVRPLRSLNPCRTPRLSRRPLSLSCSTFRTRCTCNLIMSYIQGKSLRWGLCDAACAYGRLNAFGGGKRAERSRSHLHGFTDEGRGEGRGGGGRAEAHRSAYESVRPKGIFASVRLDAHLFRQSGASSRILANNISSASFSFRRGSSALYFWSLFPFASVGCRRRCRRVFFRGCARVCLQGPRRASQCLCQETGSKHTSGNVFSSGRGRNSLICGVKLLCQNKMGLTKNNFHRSGFAPSSL